MIAMSSKVCGICSLAISHNQIDLLSIIEVDTWVSNNWTTLKHWDKLKGWNDINKPRNSFHCDHCECLGVNKMEKEKKKITANEKKQDEDV